MMNKVVLGLALLVIINAAYGQREGKKKNEPMEFPMTEKHWAANR